MTLTGRPDDPPTFCAPAINDKATGMWCVIGALAALQQRDRTGKGCVVDTSLFESAVAWVEGPLNNYLLNGSRRSGMAPAASLVPYQTFETADRPICIAAGNDRLFVKCAGVLGHPEWLDDPRFAKGRDRGEPARVDGPDGTGAARQSRRLDGRTGEGRGAVRAGERHRGAGRDRAAPRGGPDANPARQRAESGRAADLVRRERPHPRSDAPKLGEHNAEVLSERRTTAAE